MKGASAFRYIISLLAALSPIGCATTQTAQQGIWNTWLTESPESLTQAAEAMRQGKIRDAESYLTPSMRKTNPAADYLYAECAALRGDIPGAIDRFSDFITAHGDSALSAPALARMTILYNSTMLPADWDRILSLKVTDPYALARLIVLQDKALRSKPERANLVHPTALPLVRWRWLGTFSPYLMTGFTSKLPFDDDAILADSYHFEGKTVKSFRYAPDLRTPFDAVQGGIYAGETGIRLSRAGDVLITGYSDQLYEISIDGKPVLTHGIEDIGKNKILSATVHLSSGEHILRTRLGRLNGASSIGFWISPIGAQSENLKIEELENIRAISGDKDSVTNIQRIDINHITGGTADNIPNDTIRSWIAASAAIADSNTQTAEALIQARQKTIKEDDPAADYLRALRYRADADIEPAVRSEYVIDSLRKVMDKAPEMAHASMLLMTEMLVQGQPKMALEIYENSKANLPVNADTSYILSELAGKLGWSDIAGKYTLDAAKQGPTSCRLNALALELEAQNHRFTSYDALTPKLQSCPSIISAYAKREGNDTADSHRWEQAIRALSKDYPNDSRLKLEVLLMQADRDPVGAAEAMTRWLDGVRQGYHPDIEPGTALRFIDRLRAANHESEAAQILNLLADIYPVEESYRNLLQVMQNSTPFESLRIDGMKTIKNYLAQGRTESGNSVMVLDYAATHVFPNGARLGLTHIISRALSKEGKNAIGEVYLPQNAAVLKLHTIKGDTLTVIEPESIGFKSSITAPNLAEGDFVEVEYLTYDRPTSAFTNRVALDTFLFGSNQSPTVRSEFVFEYPKDWQIQIAESGPANAINKNCTPIGDYMRCNTYIENIPVILEEPKMASEFDIIPNIQVYHEYGWDVIQRGLYETTVQQTRITPYVENFYKTINFNTSLENPQNASIWEKARIIYDAAVKGIDESESQRSDEADSATHSVTRGTGSRIITLKALYDTAGINSYFALVKSTNAPRNISNLPTLYDSGYTTLLIAETEKGPAYAQPSEDFIPFDYLEPEFQNSEVIPLNPDIQRFISRKDSIESMRASIDIDYTISEDGSASARSKEIMRGTRSLVMRNFFNVLKNDKDKSHQIIQNSLSSSYGRIALTSLDYQNLEDNYKPLVLNYNFDIASFASPEAGKLEIISKMFAYNLVKQFAPISVTERKYPTAVGNDILSQRTLTFHAPQGYTWDAATLQDINIDTRFGKFSRTLKLNGAVLTLVETIELLPQYIELKDYSEFRDFCLAVDEAQRTRISAKK